MTAERIEHHPLTNAVTDPPLLTTVMTHPPLLTTAMTHPPSLTTARIEPRNVLAIPRDISPRGNATAIYTNIHAEFGISMHQI